MKHPVLHEPERNTPAGIDRSINQDDDAEHPTDAPPEPPRRDLATGTDAWDKPGLVGNEGPRA